MISLHHVHLYTSDMAAAIKFYQKFFDAEVVMDMHDKHERYVSMQIGKGRLLLLQTDAPTPNQRGLAHIGIQTDDQEALLGKLKQAGVPLREKPTDYIFWKTAKVEGPDNVLIEILEIDKEKMPKKYIGFFD